MDGIRLRGASENAVGENRGTWLHAGCPRGRERERVKGMSCVRQGDRVAWPGDGGGARHFGGLAGGCVRRFGAGLVVGLVVSDE